jgi:hypothetical protein
LLLVMGGRTHNKVVAVGVVARAAPTFLSEKGSDFAMKTLNLNKNFPLIANHRREINRLITAAAVSTRFCDLLLSTPDLAIAAGYNGEGFFLSPEEKTLVLSIRAATLAEFAQQLLEGRRKIADGQSSLIAPFGRETCPATLARLEFRSDSG